jgi:hypothetical protein
VARTIDLQRKTRPLAGCIEHYWFENALTGLARTLFHRIVIPLEPFDSGLDYVPQPESTELVVEWIALGLSDPAALDGVVIASGVTPHVEASVYLGSAHNWVDIKDLRLTKDGGVYLIHCKAIVEFETEGVGQNERWEFATAARYVGRAKDSE